MLKGDRKSKLDLLAKVPEKDAVILKEGEYKFYFDRRSWTDQLVQLTQSKYSDAHRSEYMNMIDSIQKEDSYIDPKVLKQIASRMKGSEPITPTWATDELCKIHFETGKVFIKDANDEVLKKLIRTKEKNRFGYFVIFMSQSTNQKVYSYYVKTEGNF